MTVPSDFPGPHRVLVVDDEAAVRTLLGRILRQAGYEIFEAASGEEALEIVTEREIELMLTDIDMPGMDGLALLAESQLRDPHLEVVMVTGMMDTGIAVRAMRDGANDFITKPFHVGEVQITVERGLEKRRLLLENLDFQRNLEQRVDAQTREILQGKQRLERLYRRLEETYESTLQAMMTALDFRDHETHGHSWRVVQYSVLVAERTGLREPELTTIRWGAILHDVGKIGLPDSILLKPGPLNEDEWREMRKHPLIGYRMLEHINFLKPALEIVLSHHERWDGAGYPQGLQGAAIPIGARIFSIVDTFDAMTSSRPYRAALPIRAALDEIRKNAGSQFDASAAEAFLSFPEQALLEIRERAHRAVAAASDPIRKTFLASDDLFRVEVERQERGAGGDREGGEDRDEDEENPQLAETRD